MKTKFPEILKELRIEKGLNQIELAKELGLSKSIVSFWENNLRVPTLTNLITLAKYFKVSIDYLAGLED